LTDFKFKLEENHPTAEHNMWHVFKVIMTKRPDIEVCLWQILELYSEQNTGTWKHRLIVELLLSFMNLMAISEFWPEAENGSFRACTVQIC